jgi:hypothetical protein
LRTALSVRRCPRDEADFESAGVDVQRAGVLVADAAVGEGLFCDLDDVVAVPEAAAVRDPGGDLADEEVSGVGVDVATVGGATDGDVAGVGAVWAVDASSGGHRSWTSGCARRLAAPELKPAVTPIPAPP